MKQYPVFQKLCETAWRRPLTPAEQADLRAWLAAHPEFEAEAQAEAALSVALARLPDAPVPSNFTARVLRQIEAEARAAAPGHRPPVAWWRLYWPQLAGVSAVVVLGAGLWRVNLNQQQQLVQTAQEVAAVKLFSDPTLLTDFEEIASLTPPAATPDDILLAMSEELLALHQ
jgi:hypothetical protein